MLHGLDLRDTAYKPAELEHKQVYGITFEQGRQDLLINADTMLGNLVTENKPSPKSRSAIW